MTTEPPVEHPADSTTLTSNISQGYSIRCWLIMIVCLVLGLWGVYDYVWAIPTQAEHAERRELTQEVRILLDVSDIPVHRSGEELISVLRNKLGTFQFQVPGTGETDPLRMMTDELDRIEPRSREAWMITMMIYITGLQAELDVQVNFPVHGSREAAKQTALALAARSLDLYGDAQTPSIYDRPVQWLFMISLIFIPFYAWSLLVFSPKKYALEEDGTLHLPEGAWSRDDTADIDMTRWMSKSTAWIEHVDGTRIKLDAHIYKNLHLIIGAVAHRFHPDKWQEDGRKVKPLDESEPEPDEEQES